MAPTLGISPVTSDRAQVLWTLLDLLVWKAASQLELFKLGHPDTAQSYPAVEQYPCW